MSNNALENLKSLFKDRPEVMRLLNLREVDLVGRLDEAFLETIETKEGLFPEPVNVYATGKTGQGKLHWGEES